MTKAQKIVLGVCVPIAIAEIIVLIIFSVILASPPHEQRDFTFIDRGTLLKYCPKIVLPSKDSETAIGEAQYQVTSSNGAFVTDLQDVEYAYVEYRNEQGWLKANFYKDHSYRPSLELQVDETFYVSIRETENYRGRDIAIQKISLKDEGQTAQSDGALALLRKKIAVSFAADSRVYRMEYYVEGDFETEKEKPLAAMKSVVDALIEKGVIA